MYVQGGIPLYLQKAQIFKLSSLLWKWSKLKIIDELEIRKFPVRTKFPFRIRSIFVKKFLEHWKIQARCLLSSSISQMSNNELCSETQLSAPGSNMSVPQFEAAEVNSQTECEQEPKVSQTESFEN